ncbi:hypothetical protein DICVIV_14152 [Dictyocaulus viviparus]|uniref:Transmembrane protein 65 n=1 Tax=Dictyocaulus viviparus TaxID=29172 RepID=A0A0D8X5X7_DICVI|nr:hypothetical protein DICVIV_14152 [Dictyocaulus viviparus]
MELQLDCYNYMRLLATAGRLASRISVTGGCESVAVEPVVHRRFSTGAWQVVKRTTTTGAFHSLEKPIIEDHEEAIKIATRLTSEEQTLLRDALEELATYNGVDALPMTAAQTRALFIVNTLPFIGFGFLDNMIMIVAGQYIDQKLGTLLCLSTMAAAALGNLISDVAGIGLAHYVESVFSKLGVKHPVLSSEQLSSTRARLTTNGARAVGLSIGCIIGMFPLLFYENDRDNDSEIQSKDSTHHAERKYVILPFEPDIVL